MVRVDNHLGSIDISHSYFASLVSDAVSDCFGVAGMAHTSARQGILAKVLGKEPEDKGIRVRMKNEKLYIDLHIIVSYGTNISAIVKSIMHKVRFCVEEKTGFDVGRVNVYVDGMNAQ